MIDRLPERRASTTLPRARLILNPAAGRDAAAEQAVLINSRLRERYESLEVVLTIGAGDCEAAARRAVEDGCRHLFVGGGDGTINAYGALLGDPFTDGGDRTSRPGRGDGLHSGTPPGGRVFA